MVENLDINRKKDALTNGMVRVLSNFVCQNHQFTTANENKLKTHLLKGGTN